MFLIKHHFVIATIIFLSNQVGQCHSQGISIPVGTLLPQNDDVLSSVFKFALKQYNSVKNVPSSSSKDVTGSAIRFRVFLQTAQINNSFMVSQEICSHITHRTHAIIGSSTPTTNAIISSYANAFHLPWITLNTFDFDSPFVISLQPNIEMLVQDFILKMKWKRTTVVFDSEDSLLSTKKWLKFERRNKIEIAMRLVKEKYDFLVVLREISCNSERNIVLDLSIENSLIFLDQINVIGMATEKFICLFTNLDLVNIDMSRYKFTNGKLVLLNIVDQSTAEYQELQNAVLSSIPKFLQKKKAALLYDAFTTTVLGFESLALSGFAFGLAIEDELKKSNLISCNLIPVAVLRTGQDVSRAFKQVFKTSFSYKEKDNDNVRFKGLTGNVQFNSKGQRINYTVDILKVDASGKCKIGSWNDATGSKFSTSFTKFLLKSDEENKTLVVTTIIDPPFVMLKKKWKRLQGNERFEGFCVELLQEISKITKLNFNLRLVSDAQYGCRDKKSGRWSGMIGEVYSKIADLAVAPLTITSSREAVVDFTTSFMSVGISIITKKLNHQKSDIFKFLRPLSTETWVCVGFAYACFAAVQYLIIRLNTSQQQTFKYLIPKRKLDHLKRDDIVDDKSCIPPNICCTSECGRQGNALPKPLSWHIIDGVWWFFTLVIVSFYIGNCFVYLSASNMKSQGLDLKDLLSQADVEFGIQRSEGISQMLERPSLSTDQRLWPFMRFKLSAAVTRTDSMGINDVKQSNGKFVFMMESSFGDYWQLKQPCDLAKVDTNIDLQGYGFAMQKGSVLRKRINLAIMKLREEGKLQQLQDNWWKSRGECEVDDLNSKKSQLSSLLSVAGMFCILIVGLFLAILISIAEVILRKYSRKKGAKTPCKKSKKNRMKTDTRDINISRPSQFTSAVWNLNAGTGATQNQFAM